MNRIEHTVEYFFRQRFLLHASFWLLILAFYVLFFGRRNDNYGQTFFFVSLLMPITIGTTYVLNYFLIPIYLMRERFLKFFFYLTCILLTSLFMEMMVALITFMAMAGSHTSNMSPASFDLVFLLTSLMLVACMGVTIKMVLYWRQSREDYERLAREKVEAELKFLKAQLNPHFLFNTLNNLYYLSVEKSDRAPKAILALSEMLDYVLNAGKSTTVSLAKEIQHVNNFISLEMLRYEDRVNIEMMLDGDMESHSIPPMLLITLMENAFKHGVMPSIAQSWIKFLVRVTHDKIMVEISNSRNETVSGNGIGLKNLRGQLELLYPKGYSLEVVDRQSEFSVNLVLKSSHGI